MPDIKLLIFDLDGTLIDSLPDLADATNHTRAHYHLPPLSPDAVRKLVGQGARSLVARALPQASPDEVEDGLKLFLDYNMAHIADKTRVYPGVPETLQALRDQGMHLCVLSNKNVALCREVMAKLGIDSYFFTIVGADTYPFRKPSPEPILAMLGEFGADPRESVMIGDSINDMAAGEGAGVLTIGCSYGYGDITELAGAKYVVHDFPSLLSLPILA